MDTDEARQILKNALLLAEAGKEDHALNYLKDQLPRLPEELQDEIAAYAFMGAVSEQARQSGVLRRIVEEGLEATRLLEAAKAEIEKGGAEDSNDNS